MSTIIDTADAAVTMLNDASPLTGQAFTALRHYSPVIDRKDLSALTVSVAPGAWDISLLSRNSSENEYRIDIGIQKGFTAAERVAINTELDPLMTFVEAIVDLFDRQPIGATGPRCRRIENDPAYSPEAFIELREFRSIVRLFCWKGR